MVLPPLFLVLGKHLIILISNQQRGLTCTLSVAGKVVSRMTVELSSFLVYSKSNSICLCLHMTPYKVLWSGTVTLQLSQYQSIFPFCMYTQPISSFYPLPLVYVCAVLVHFSSTPCQVKYLWKYLLKCIQIRSPKQYRILTLPWIRSSTPKLYSCMYLPTHPLPLYCRLKHIRSPNCFEQSYVQKFSYFFQQYPRAHGNVDKQVAAILHFRDWNLIWITLPCTILYIGGTSLFDIYKG